MNSRRNNNHILTAILVFLALLVWGNVAAAQPADTAAERVPAHFSCTAGAGEIFGPNAPCPTCEPTGSTQYERTDTPGFPPVCVVIQTAGPDLGKAKIDFQVSYVAGSPARIVAFPYASTDCTGTKGPVSLNACIATHGPPEPPVFE